VTAFACAPAVDAELARAWGRAAAQAAREVPAHGAEAADWTVRGWAETALGCAVGALPGAFEGLDDVVRACGIPRGGLYADRLRELRGLGGAVPGCYADGPPRRALPPARLPEAVREACLVLAGYCDGLDAALLRHAGPRGEPAAQIPVWTTGADHLRWGERFRASTGQRGYQVVASTVPQRLVRRSWMRLPSADRPYAVSIRPADAAEATVRERVRQGLHNGAHLDHLACLAGRDGMPPWRPAPIEFGAGLMTAEAFAMSVEILSAAECALAGRGAEAREVYRGLVSRIGRVPGFKQWQAGRPAASPALRRARLDRVEEFATLPTLAGAYLAGPLRLIARDWADPLLPDPLVGRVRARWAVVSARFEPAAALAAAVGGFA
jgi:hypothetical protein